MQEARKRWRERQAKLPCLVHKNKRTLGLIEARGARVLYLPAYSPGMNPIEMAFSKLKAPLRKRAARSLGQLMPALAQILKSFGARQSRNFFRHAQYASI